MELTRMFFGANSMASECVRLSKPARAAEVATMCGSGCSASNELTQTTEAADEASSIEANARTGCITPNNFRSNSWRNSSSAVSAKVATLPCPALLMRMSVRPKCCLAASPDDRNHRD